MIRVENLIVEGKCFIQSSIEPQNIDGLKSLLMEFMSRKGYYPEDFRTIFFRDRFLTMKFYLEPAFKKIPLILKMKKAFGLVDEEEIQWQKYSYALKRTRNDMPFEISLSLIPSKLKDKEGFAITIRSEPVILFKIRSLGERPVFDEFDYSNIVDTNRDFIEEIMRATGAVILEKPRAIAEYTKTPTLEKLEKFGFDGIAKLIREGKIKIERGNTEDGLTDLREALKDFVSESVRKIGGEPKNSIPKDLGTLKELGYINKWMYEVIYNFLYEWIYSYLSAKPVHGRERINFDDSKFLFSISEEIINYLLEKIMLGR